MQRPLQPPKKIVDWRHQSSSLQLMSLGHAAHATTKQRCEIWCEARIQQRTQMTSDLTSLNPDETALTNRRNTVCNDDIVRSRGVGSGRAWRAQARPLWWKAPQFIIQI